MQVSPLDDQPLLLFLTENFDRRARDLEFVGAGYFSQAFSFRTDQGEFILRIGSNPEAFRKDAFAYQQFHAAQLPIPEILTMGNYENSLSYAISEKLPGVPTHKLNDTTSKEILPQLIQTIETIRSLTLDPKTGFGILNSEGFALQPFPSWKDYLVAINDWPNTFLARQGEQFKPWSELRQTGFVDYALVGQLVEELHRLSIYCPEEKHVVHGDFGGDNLLSDGQRVTGVLDWAELRCGDFVYDIAYLDYHSNINIPYATEFKNYYNLQGIPIAHFDERIRCCQIHIALGGIFLHANRLQEEEYLMDLPKMRELVRGKR